MLSAFGVVGFAVGATPALAADQGVSGTVTAAVGGAGVGNVFVDVYDSTGSIAAQVTTDANGDYSATGLAVSATGYTVCFDATSATGGGSTTGYQSQCYQNVPWSPGNAPPTGTTAVPVASGQTVTGINAALIADGGISGTVTAASGAAAVSGAYADVYDSTGTFLTQAITDASGDYSITGLAPSATGYTVCFDATNGTGGSSTTGYQSQCYQNVPWSPGNALPTGTTAVPVTAGQVATAINAALIADGGISGTVTAASGGAAVSGAYAYVYDSTGTFLTQAITDASGDYSITGLAPSATGYTVCFDPTFATGAPATGYSGQCYQDVPWIPGSTLPTGTTAVPVSAGTTVTGIDAALAAAAGITGTVTAAAGGAGVGGVSVDVYDSTGNFVTATSTDSSGDYTVAQLPPSDTGYTLCFDATSATSGGSTTGYSSQCYQNVPWTAGNIPPPGATLVPVAANQDVTGINAALAAAGGISGTVTAASGAGPVANVTVRVFDSANQDLAETLTSAAGTYSIIGLAPSATGYAVCFDATEATGGGSTTGYASQCYNNVPWTGGFLPASGATPVPVSSGATATGIDAPLAAAGAIGGTVTASGGGGLGNVLVDVTDAAGDFVTQLSTDSSGNYSVNGLAASATGYTVCFDATSATGGNSTTGYSSQCYQNVPWTPGTTPPPGTTSVPVSLGKVTTGVSAALRAQAGISGTVTSATTHAGLAGVQVRIFDADGLYLVSTATSSTGSYAITGLAPSSGGYLVCFDAAQVSYASQCSSKVSWPGGYIAPTSAAPVQLLSSGPVTINASLLNQGGISGTVTASGTGSGVGGVSVDVYDGTGTYLTSATTGPDGGYIVTGLAASKAGYHVCFDPSTAGTATLYAGQCYKNAPWSGTADLPAGQTAVPVVAGGTAAGVDAVLVPAGTITGKVTAASGGGALGGVSVEVLDAAGNPVTATSTASDGTYSAPGLAPSTTGYRVCFDATAASGGSSATGYASQCFKNVPWSPGTPPPAGIKPVPVSAGRTAAGIGAALASAGAISGRASAASGGAGLAGVLVDVFGGGGNPLTSVLTDGSGSYSVLGLASSPTGYTVCFDASAATGGPSLTGYQSQCYKEVAWTPGGSLPAKTKPVPVSAGKTATGINAALTAAGAISGTVTTGSGGGVSDVTVDIYNGSGGYVTQASTDGSGGYSIAGLAPSATGYTVCFDTSGIASAGFASQCYKDTAWTGGQTLPPGTTPVPVSAGKTATGTDAVLVTGGSITGTVSATAGGVLGGVKVDIFDSTGNSIATATTLPDGTYSVTGLPKSAGYKACFDASAAAGGTSKTGWADQCYNGVAWTGNSPLPPGITPVPVSVGETVTGINAKLAAAGVISGTVTAKSGGAKLAGVTVHVYDTAGHLIAEQVTGANGAYSVGGLAVSKGDKICFDASAAIGGTSKTGYADQCYKGVAWTGSSALPPGIRPVPVTADASVTGISAALPSGGSISGTVTALTGGGALAGTLVTIFDKSGNLLAAVATGDNGTYTVVGLQPNATGYAVCFAADFATGGSSATGYKDQCYSNVAWTGTGKPPSTAKKVPVTAGTVKTGINAKLKNK